MKQLNGFAILFFIGLSCAASASNESEPLWKLVVLNKELKVVHRLAPKKEKRTFMLPGSTWACYVGETFQLDMDGKKLGLFKKAIVCNNDRGISASSSILCSDKDESTELEVETTTTRYILTLSCNDTRPFTETSNI